MGYITPVFESNIFVVHRNVVCCIDRKFVRISHGEFVLNVKLTCRMMDLMRDTSREDFEVFGLKSQSFEILSHSVPGSILVVSATSSFSADLRGNRG